MSANTDHFKKRIKHDVPDWKIRNASEQLSERQFIAWAHAMLRGLSNVEISDQMSDAETIVFPSEVQDLLVGAHRRGFAIPGEDYYVRHREKVSA